MKVLKKVKYNGQIHKVGSSIKVKEEDKAELIRRGIVKEKLKSSYSKPQIEEKEDNSYSNLTIAEIKVILDNQGIEYANDMRKDELLELLEGA